MPGFLMPECLVHSDGCGPSFELGPDAADSMRLVLHVTHTVSRECLVVSVLGSADGIVWNDKPLAVFPQVCLNGVHEATIVSKGLRYLRAEWKVKRWERSNSPAVFGFSLEAEALMPELAASAGG